jgi:hypothetical protein
VEPGSGCSYDCGWVGGGFCRNGGVVLRKVDTCLAMVQFWGTTCGSIHPMLQLCIGQAMAGERQSFCNLPPPLGTLPKVIEEDI